MIKHLFLYFFFSVFLWQNSVAEPLKVLELNENEKIYSPGSFIKVFTDAAFKNEVSKINFDSNHDAIFLKINIINHTNTSKWLLGFGDSNEKIAIYTIVDGMVVDSIYCGSSYTLLQKAVKTGRGEYGRIYLPKDKPVVILVKIRNATKFARHLLKYSISESKLYHPEAFDANRNIGKLINVFFYGAILLMIFYNLMLAITLNSRGYAFYVIFSLLFLCFNMASDGLLRETFFKDTTNHYHMVRLLITPLMLIVYVHFGRIYMQTSYLVTKADKYARYLMIMLLVSYIPMMAGEWWISRLVMLVLAVVTVLFMMVVAAMCVIRNYFPARYFLAGNLILLASGLAYILYLTGVIPHNDSTKVFEFIPQIGAIFDLAIFSLGLANRIKVIELELVKNEIEAEHEKQSLIEEKNVELERRVKERTEELHAQKEEISAINEELEEKVRERTKKLQKAYRDLLNLNYELDTFIYRAAHDIRGPITTIMGLCNLALMEKDFKKCQEYLLVLEKFSKNTQFTLNRILSVNEIKNNHIKPSTFVLARLKEGVMEMLADNPNRGKVAITFEMNEEEEVYYDLYLLKLMVHSMVDNAVRFRSNDITVKSFCHVFIYKSNDQGLVVRVTDNGQGIESSIREKVFDMFYRGNEYSSGSGLGLYICKIAAKKLNGDVELVSSKKGETIFELKLAKLKVRKMQYIEHE